MSVLTEALWTWDTTSAVPVVSGFSSGAATKTGLLPSDLRAFVTVPLQDYSQKPPVPVSDATLLQWIRFAEDWIETETGILLCQTWVASPPAVTQAQAQAIGITTTSSGGFQLMGFDYDLSDAAYDFIFPRAQDEGWMIYSLRYKPVKDVEYGPFNTTAIKNMSYVYPLLNEFFRVPPEWMVEDHDFGLVRLVPAVNVQMLPLFAMQLAFMGFAESVPGAIWLQYRAGLTANDYNSRWAFMKQLVLAQAAMTALQSVQGTINMGAAEYRMFVDGLQYGTKYFPNGPFGFLINQFQRQRGQLMAQALSKVGGPVFSTV